MAKYIIMLIGHQCVAETRLLVSFMIWKLRKMILQDQERWYCKTSTGFHGNSMPVGSTSFKGMQKVCPQHIYITTGTYTDMRSHPSGGFFHITDTLWWKATITSSHPGQNGRHFGRRHFQMHFLKEKVRILIKISLEFVPNGLIDNI